MSTHTIAFMYINAGQLVGSVAIQFCANAAIAEDTCVAPAGLSVEGAVLTNQQGESGFTAQAISPNELLMSRNPALTADFVLGIYTFANILNPSAAGEYWLKIASYSSETGSEDNLLATAWDDMLSDNSPLIIQFGGIAIAIVPGLTIGTVVPPYIIFCSGITIPEMNCASASGSQINFGVFSKVQANYGTSQFLVATNAQNGYNITITGATLTSGNNIIPALSSLGASTPGTDQFGINLVANSDPAIGSNIAGDGPGFIASNYSSPNNFMFSSGDTIASSTIPSDYNRYTISYLVNVMNGQAEGVYATTLSYIAVGNF